MMDITSTKQEIDEQKVRILAGLAKCSQQAARRYLSGEHVKGIFLRQRLAAAVKKAEELCPQGEGVEPTPIAR